MNNNNRGDGQRTERVEEVSKYTILFNAMLHFTVEPKTGLKVFVCWVGNAGWVGEDVLTNIFTNTSFFVYYQQGDCLKY